MIRYIKLKNYMSLVDFEANFMKTTSIPKKLILIYGENGIGKTNLTSAFYTLQETTNTMSSIEVLKELMKTINEKDLGKLKKYHLDFLNEFKDTEGIINAYKTINAKENMVLEYGFKIKDKKAIYKIEMNDSEIVYEKLDYVLKSNLTCFFELTKETKKINENIFTDKKYYYEFYDMLDKYWGKHSLLSILSFEIIEKKKDYVQNRICSQLYSVLLYIKAMSIKINIGNNNKFNNINFPSKTLQDFERGKILRTKEEELNKTELFLNNLFIELYSDIKQVYYYKEYKEEAINYQLYVKKLINNQLIDINFKLESTGTKNILNILPFLISAYQGKTVIIDEFDTGIHDILVDNIITNIVDYIDGQLIISTHNTMLFESNIPKQYIYVFNVDSKGIKKLLPITKFKGSTHQNLNYRKQYLKGMYGGIPFVNDLDFDELFDNLET